MFGIRIALYPNATRLLQPADVSAFKLLKNGWKRGVSRWSRENQNQSVTVRTFAPILKVVIDDSLNKTIIKQGFRATGLFPWNPYALDYTKCLAGQKGTSARAETEVTSGASKGVTMNLDRFADLVGHARIESFKERQAHGKLAGENDDSFLLYQMYRILRTQHRAEENDTIEINEEFPNDYEL